MNAVGKANRTVQEVKDKWENLHSTEKKKTKTKQKELCNFSKDGFHHQPLALDEIFLLGNHIVSINDSFILALCSLPLWFYIDGVKSFPINEIVSVRAGVPESSHVSRRRCQLHQGTLPCRETLA